MTNYARIARNDDETFSDEAEFVAKRKAELFEEWRKDQEAVKEAIAELLSDDGDDYFAGKLAKFFTSRNDAFNIGDAAASIHRELLASAALNGAIEHLIVARLERDAETAAQAEWDSRLTGPEGDL